MRTRLKPFLNFSLARPTAATLVLLMMGCSFAAQMRRDRRLRKELDGHRFQQPLSVVWPAGLRLLAERGYELVGHDRTVVGAPEEAWWKHVIGGGFETTRLDGQGLVMETKRNASGIHYRLEGTEVSPGACRVLFFTVRQTEGAPEHRSRDLEAEFELVRRLEPAAAAQMQKDAEAP
ncbi:MAG TPA: hypothetical protein VMK12_20445 [Anaeromyxobacteraceae bacterium]|nr:hypothetical protein [Anaeromyxobacteraceae bacterium]